MESTAGLAALALFVMWIGFYVPHRVRQRQQFLEARTEDRFSGSLRVLAVAGPGMPDVATAVPDGLAPASVERVAPRALLGPAPGGAPVERGTQGDGRTHEEGQGVMQSSVTAEPVRRSGKRAVPAPQPSSRLAVLERRAAAARRRLALTALLLLVSVVVWVVVALALAPWWAAAIPTALLAAVLVLGRRAVLGAQRSDSAWLAERRAADRAARGTVAGSPPAPRAARPRVTGHAVHGSQVSTQMIPRVTAAELARRVAAASDAATSGAAAEGEARAGTGPAASGTEDAQGGDEGDRAPDGVAPPEAPAAGPARTPSGRAWDPVPVPAPTYTMKPAAPRREPAPLEVDRQDRVAPPAAPAVPAEVADGAGRAAGDEQKPKTETLGLDLNEILARRRAAGQ